MGGLGLSISRSIYSLMWLDGSALVSRSRNHSSASETPSRRPRQPPAWISAHNALVYSFSMSFERAALVVNDKFVALTGRNAFFPHKPADFHATCAAYARVSAALQLSLLAVAGPGALLWLYLAELGWQLPVHPASAMFVSNHPSLHAPGRPTSPGVAHGVGGCQPTSSIYLGGWYDWLVCFSNFHTEHHDFPDVPAFRLRELRDAAPAFYAEGSLAGARDGWWSTMRRTFAGRSFYACSGDMEAVESSDGDAELTERSGGGASAEPQFS